MNPHYEFVAARAGHRCEYCHAPEVVFNFPFEVEHIIPTVLHGADVEHNWALACRACNVRKGPYLQHRDPVTQAVVQLYHPRRDSWSTHFCVVVDTGAIEGLTAVGRATVALLDNLPASTGFVWACSPNYPYEENGLDLFFLNSTPHLTRLHVWITLVESINGGNKKWQRK